MLTSNFDFLKLDEDLGELVATANIAEESFTYQHFENVLFNTRKLAEHLAKLVADRCYLDAERLTFHNTLKLIDEQIEDPSGEVMMAFRRLKGRGNDAVHVLNSEQATKENAEKSLASIHFLLVWFMKTYVDDQLMIRDFFIPQAQQRYQTAERKFIYIQTVDNSNGGFSAYDGTQKIGEGTIAEDDMEADWTANSDFLRQVAPKRIKQYMTTAGLTYQLGWVELAWQKAQKKWFHDHDVHEVLKRSGIKQAEKLQGNEWFEVDLETAKAAIKAVKEGRYALNLPATADEAVLSLRPNQQDAVNQTKAVFKKKDRMLWNAKMRFGKTLASLQLIKDMGFEKVLLMTHRPVVKNSWFDDFGKMKMAEAGYRYGAKDRGEKLEVLKMGETPFIYFASIQLLRYGGGEVNLADYADVDWDLIIIDEAHEGTQTELNQTVMTALVKEKTKILELSGTPFNLLDQYDEEQVYTWDYTMEQEAKLRWERTHPDKPNPYGELPRVEMYTFEMANKEQFADESKSFNFREFFKVDDKEELVYKREVQAFLDQISQENPKTDYPFSTANYRETLRHTLWLLPGVKEAAAFEQALLAHPVFGKDYTIVNVVKDGDNSGEATADDLEKVQRAIGDDPSLTKTITLTVRKLTTGVNVPEWTGVVFLNNTTSPMNYLQAAFRAQTPFSHETLGKKEVCYVFDFAPDRALTVMAESARINSGVGKKNSKAQTSAMTKLLNFMPILSNDGNGMKTYNVDRMLTQLKKVYAEKAVRSGFEDDSLYNDQLLTLTADDASLFNDVKAIVGTTNKERQTKIIINDNGMSEEEHEQAEVVQKKPKKQRTKEEEELLAKLKEAKNQRKAMISILRGVSIRIPMMIYGMMVDLDEDISIDRFISAVDDASWQEFMPKGFTKGMFRKIVRFYDPEVFIEAGRIIRCRAKSFDRLGVIERAEKIAELFSTFKNPDKETVLTPWRVVNLQVTKTIGGLNFFDDSFTSMTIDGKSALHWVEREDSSAIYQKGKTFLDINAKTGLYPLHAAISLFHKAVETNEDSHFDELAVYGEILQEQIYAVAKTPMAKTITDRTLAGYRNLAVNVAYIDGLSQTLKTDLSSGQDKIKEVFKDVKFDVVIGNPPYQEEGIGENTQTPPIYHKFMELSYQLSDKVALITPARFLFNAGATPKDFNRKMLADTHLKVVHYEQDSSKVFPNTDIKGGVVVTYRDTDKDFGEIETFTAFEELSEMYKIVSHREDFLSITPMIFSPESYKFTEELHKDFPDIESRLSKGHKYDVKTNVLEKLPEIFTDNPPSEPHVQILGRVNNERTFKYAPARYVRGPLNFEMYKVFLPKANGSGAIGEVLSTPLVGTPLVGTPLVGHTQTFLSIGAFETLAEAEALLKYIKTPFARTLLGVLKITQDNTKSVWKYVPWFDFSDNSTIDWTKSVDEIHEQLCDYYDIPRHIRLFMKKHVKAMD
ncbi:Eco57I restriction-modification methylase domain-containing protein [Streptococcus sp. E24BD]|uniref:Eco57I restriction-modification methylase domain-containing protein n=1 Tax=Streptococcus sp. E24BD TaxID=3278715 RepID=UPI00359E7507